MSFLRNKPRPVFTQDETSRLLSAIREAEEQTSGEIRVFVERRCKYVDALDRAKQIFDRLEMEKTQLRNAVLFYVATHDRQIAIFADEGIHKEMGSVYWQEILSTLINIIKKETIVTGLSYAIKEIGMALQNHFPYDGKSDKNELPDDIVFGK